MRGEERPCEQGQEYIFYLKQSGQHSTFTSLENYSGCRGKNGFLGSKPRDWEPGYNGGCSHNTRIAQIYRELIKYQTLF